MYYPNEAVVAARLLNYAKWYAASKGFKIAEHAERHLGDDASTATQEIIKEARRLKSPAKAEGYIRQAEAAFSLLIDRMIIERRRIPEYAGRHPNIIGEQTRARALQFLCPLWPICK